MPSPDPSFVALVDVPELQAIRGVPFAAGITFRQVVVTGPPGTGKTTLVAKIGGWPDEGYVDLTQRNWWRSRILAFRPRQIHLGLPFEGHSDALSMFEREWLDPEQRPDLELDRILLPALGRRRSPWKHRRKYVFEFLLPPAHKVFEARKERSDRRSHVIDVEVSVERVREQLDVYWRVARYFHQSGMLVYVRDDFGAPPRIIDEPVTDPATEATKDPPTVSRSWLHHYFRQFTSAAADRVIAGSRRVHLAGSRARVARSTLPIELVSGSHRVRVYAETVPAELESRWPNSVRVFDTEAYFSGIAGFTRLTAGQSIRIGRTNSTNGSSGSEDGAFPRIELTNENGTIIVTDLETSTGTVIVPLNDLAEVERLDRDRTERLNRVRDILGGLPPALDTATASATLERAIQRMEANPWRPPDSRGRPGGLIELPDRIVPIIVGDLHANLDNLLIVLSEGRFLDTLERGEAAFIILGDAVHPEEGADLREMDSSIAIMDAIAALIGHFGDHFIYLCGNHDSFAADVTKQGIAQGRLWKEAVRRRRGRAFVALMEHFYETLPYVVAGDGFITCHAGPPVEAITRDKLIDIHNYPHFVYQLTWNRIQSPRNPGGYTKRDVRSLQKALGMGRSAAVIVSHNPREGEDTAVVELGGVRGHHLVYSAKRDRFSVFTRIGDEVQPLTYPGRSVLNPVVRTMEEPS